MRPDEHKRKKNEQYKKKHGIKTNQSKPQGKVTDTSKKAEPPQSVIKPKANHAEQEEDVPVENLRHQPSFQRRKVESNWDRYSENVPSAQDEPELIGADFREILACTSSSFSQFRFKDEQEWDKEEVTGSGSQFLSINCDDLQRVVSCVPLHERLCIEPSHFQATQLDQFKKAADMNKREHHTELVLSTESQHDDGLHLADGDPANYQALLSDPTSTENTTEINQATADNIEQRDSAKELDDLDILLKDSSVVGVEQDNVIKSDDLEDIAKQLETTTTTDHTSQQNSETAHGTGTDSNDLDALTISDSYNKSHASNPIDELDELLNLDDSESVKKADPIMHGNSSGNQVKTDNLEDWLDSVLED